MNDFYRKNDPIARLAFAMVLCHLRDLKSSKKKIREEAMNWIFRRKNYRIDFDSCCFLSGLNQNKIREKLRED